jgi:3',5'-nucleoside bisphosphate phosphatase
MIPPLIVAEALSKEINLIAITDHNATANISAVQKAALGTELVVLPGVELQTREEVHSLCLFDSLDQALEFQVWIDGKLPGTKNNADFFGEQFVVDETGDFIRREDRLLLNSVAASLNEAFEQVSKLKGLFIPAHINRQAFGLLANLGMVPSEIPFEALEISRHIQPDAAAALYPQIKKYPLIQNGDVHFLDDFLGAVMLEIEEPTISEIKLALKNLSGRRLRFFSQLADNH